jgi:predicted small secreted protein
MQKRECIRFPADAKINPTLSSLSLMKHLQISPRSRTAFALIALATATVVVSSCHTTGGFGRDLQKVGHKITHEAERHG